MVLDIRPGANASSIDEDDVAVVSGVVYFEANDGLNGAELWRSDGTAAGTYLVKDIRPGASGSSSSKLTSFKGKLLFSANDGTNGAELWISDGTAAGTVLLKDINPGTNGSSPNDFYVFESTLFFRANNGTTGSELWKTDGTAAGTVLHTDINPGSTGSAPSDFTYYRGNLIFAATDKILSDEPFSLVLDACFDDPNKAAAGVCGCGIPDTDSDGDSAPDCKDACPQNSIKTQPGACGCAVADADTNSNGVADCLVAPDFKAQLQALINALVPIKPPTNSGDSLKNFKQGSKNLGALIKAFDAYAKSIGTKLTLKPGTKKKPAMSLAQRITTIKRLFKVLKLRQGNVATAKNRLNKELKALMAAVVG